MSPAVFGGTRPRTSFRMGRSASVVSASLCTLALAFHVPGPTKLTEASAHPHHSRGHLRVGRHAEADFEVGADTTYRWGEYQVPGALGTQGVGKESTPLPVHDLTDVAAVAAGNGSDMALDADGNVWTWGSGVDGSLGDGSQASHLNGAVEVAGLPKIASIAESQNTDVALAVNGTVWGWGFNRSGQLCTGNDFSYDHPVQIDLSGVSSIAGAGDHTLFLMDDGRVEACGDNTYGELGDGTFSSSKEPVAVLGLPTSSPVVSISAAWSGSSALLADGQVWDWGFNGQGQLGDGTVTNSDVPVEVKLPAAATEMYMGGSAANNGQTLVLLVDGQIWAWGNNDYGQLGNGGQSSSSVPVQATNLPAAETFVAVATGGDFSMALDSRGNVWSWGDNSDGSVGDPTATSPVLKPVVVLSHANLISATASDAVAHVPSAT